MDELAPIDSLSRRRVALRDRPSAVVGIALALLVHLVVGLFALRAGAQEGNVVRAAEQAQAQPQDEEIIEGALLRQGGGGMFDPRRIAHRQPPIRAEERASQQNGLAKNRNPTPAENRPRRDPNALITERDILGQGNQDLAERLQRMAQAEAETDPGTMPGPGSPDGSVHGTETDPNRAGHGAQAKIRSFLQRNLRLPATAPAAARRPFRLRIVISDDGSFVARGQILQGSGDETVDSDIALQLAQLVENHTPIPELTDEEKAAIAGRSYAVRYTPD
jgi:hypothetical protein